MSDEQKTYDGDLTATGGDATIYFENEDTGTFTGANNSDRDTSIRGPVRRNNII